MVQFYLVKENKEIEMAASSDDVKISKALSYLLRHGAEKEKIEMRTGN